MPRPAPVTMATRPTVVARLLGGAGGDAEAVGHDDVLGGEIGERCLAQAEHRGVDTAAEDVEHVLHARLPVGGQTPEVGPAEHDGAGTERHRLPDIGAAADAPARSEAHTSERQPLMRTSYAVFCLKKKKNNK